MIRVLFVCTGNICRSPTAEGVFRALVESEGLAQAILVDSAGTHGYHVGEPPDRRAQAAARRRGVDLSRQRARKLRVSDFSDFDLILAMDRDHERQLLALAPPGAAERVRLFLSYASACSSEEVPDPYYDGPEHFERVLDLVEEGARALLAELRARLR